MKWDRSDRQSLIQLAYASTVGIAMVLTIFGGLYFGAWLDRRLETGHHYFMFLFLAIGVIVGFRNIYLVIQKSAQDDEPIIRYIKSEPHRKRPSPGKT
ncbi:MAG: AtpZ/AtpI family protein [Syntrophaceae bacterium]|nr:AtpZ/AtpI family protein [Syntrophaceae bacterium]